MAKAPRIKAFGKNAIVRAVRNREAGKTLSIHEQKLCLAYDQAKAAMIGKPKGASDRLAEDTGLRAG